MWLAPWFLVGGVLAAGGVVLIHLMHRRRYRVVPFAAMEFLLQASRKSRRMVELRDWLLMLLRVACVLLFAVGMARPFWGGSPPTTASSRVHLVLVIDTSSSMGCNTLGRTLLDEAKAKAGEIIERLAAYSRVSLIPYPDVADVRALGEFCEASEARMLVKSLEIVDQKGDLREALQAAIEVCHRHEEPRGKQIVILSDFQKSGIPGDALNELIPQIPGYVEAVPISSDTRDNAWIEEATLLDRFVLPGTSAHVRAVVRYEGTQARPGVPVQLQIAGQTVATQIVDLLPGQAREVIFPPYPVEATTGLGDNSWLDCEVVLPSDQLPQDDRYPLVVPVFKTLPILFVDQFGAAEDPANDRYGETFLLRRLIASAFEDQAQMPPLRAYELAELDRAQLPDARVVVLAGVREPGEKRALLAEYVRLGGNLVVFAGGEFDPIAWSNGYGQPDYFLPGALKPLFVGQLSGSRGSRKPFQLDPATLQHECFFLEGMDRRELAELYRSVFFFQAVALDTAGTAGASGGGGGIGLKDPASGSAERLGTARLGSPADASRGGAGRQFEVPGDNWLSWVPALEREGRFPRLDEATQLNQPVSQSASHTPHVTDYASQVNKASEGKGRGLGAATERGTNQATARENAQENLLVAAQDGPHVLARYDNGLPFLVSRRFGRGQVFFVTTGAFRDWNTLSTSYAFIVFDRLFRLLVEETLPRRSLATHERYRLVVADPQGGSWQLVEPDGNTLALAVGALESRVFGVELDGFRKRGLHRLVFVTTLKEGVARATPLAPPPTAAGESPASAVPSAGQRVLRAGTPSEEIVLAVHGPADESRLEYFSQQELAQMVTARQWVVGESETLGQRVTRHEWWPWFVAAALLGLLAELVLLAQLRPSVEVPS